MSATCTPYFPGKQHKTTSAKGEKGKIKKLPLKMSASRSIFSFIAIMAARGAEPA
jgi:hypothetical protein